jgi:hypothetical protein
LPDTTAPSRKRFIESDEENSTTADDRVSWEYRVRTYRNNGVGLAPPINAAYSKQVMFDLRAIYRYVDLLELAALGLVVSISVFMR